VSDLSNNNRKLEDLYAYLQDNGRVPTVSLVSHISTEKILHQPKAGLLDLQRKYNEEQHPIEVLFRA